MLAFGYKATAEQFGPDELLKFGCLAENLGFDSVFVNDRFHPSNAGGKHAPFSFVWLGALGARTSTVVFGIDALTPTFRYHPSIVAQASATLATMFQNRFMLGLGTGESVDEISATGTNWPNLKERQDRLREAIELIRRLWSEERVTFRGRYYNTDKATIYDRPAIDIPIYIMARDSIAAQMAGEFADGLLCASGERKEFYEKVLLPNFGDGIRKSGRRKDSVGKIIQMNVSFQPGLAEATSAARNSTAPTLVPDESPGENAIVAENRWIISTDPDEHVERLSEYIELGFFHLVFHSPEQDQEGFLRRYSKEVLPKLRARYA